jgi:hypothetical protein
LQIVNEHFEENFNAAVASVIDFQQPAKVAKEAHPAAHSSSIRKFSWRDHELASLKQRAPFLHENPLLSAALQWENTVRHCTVRQAKIKNDCHIVGEIRKISSRNILRN